MILDLFNDIKSTITGRLSAKVEPEIDSAIFKATRFACITTAVAFVVVTARNYIGDNINCTAGGGISDDEVKAINSYCFITSTFTLSNMTLPSVSPHPGVGPLPHREVFPPGMMNEVAMEEEGAVKFHAYYQWVPFMLAIQGLLLYIPSALWQAKQGSYLELLLCNTHRVHLDKKEPPKERQRNKEDTKEPIEKKESTKKREQSVSSFKQTMGSNNKYMVWFFVSEMLACVLSISNLFLTDAFLGGEFFNFGKGALTYLTGSVTDPNNPLNIAFPKVGKCTWYKFGPTGSIVSRDAICVLPLNIVNEKMYVVLWLVYISLCAFVCTILLYHSFLLLLPGRLTALISRRSEVRTKAAQALRECSRADQFILWKLQNYVVDFTSWVKCFHQELGLKVQ